MNFEDFTEHQPKENEADHIEDVGAFQEHLENLQKDFHIGEHDPEELRNAIEAARKNNNEEGIAA